TTGGCGRRCCCAISLLGADGEVIDAATQHEVDAAAIPGPLRFGTEAKGTTAAATSTASSSTGRGSVRRSGIETRHASAVVGHGVHGGSGCRGRCRIFRGGAGALGRDQISPAIG